jgi:hypothetical protein
MGQWRKSTYSDANGGDCVETAGDQGLVQVRDTADRSGPVLGFSLDAWAAFTDALR